MLTRRKQLTKTVVGFWLLAKTPALNVVEIIEYFRDVLGFELDFLWGEPPVHGRIKKGDQTFGDPVYIHFTQAEPEEVRTSGYIEGQV